MSLWEDIVDVGKDILQKDDGSWDWQNILGIGGGALAASGLFDSESRPVGYQGKVEELEYQREQLPMDDSNRRPGEAGRRYFTDGKYVPKESQLASGGIAALKEGKYLNGSTDGMADKIPAQIDGEGGSEPALLSDGEFVIPADVVSHLGNGNSDAGAKVLYAMMDRIREARTGSKEQGKQIDPNKMLPKGVA